MDKTDNLIYIVVSAVLPCVPCPECNTSSSRIHSRYQRILRDLPWQGATVRLKLQCRRFYCESTDCRRIIFTERLPKVVRHYGRQTYRLHDTLTILGHALGGEAGLRLADRIGLESSADSILRSIKQLTPEPPPAVRVLGVDDWAWKKGQRYGTILVDLERRCPVDLLPDRSASSFEDWLLRHPGIEVIARDRASLYSQGAAAGAPDAVQVADRFHLLCNLTAAVERTLQQRQLTAPTETDREVTEPQSVDEVLPPKPPSRTELQKQDRRTRRVERYDEVLKLHQDGHSQGVIGQILGLTRKTVRRFLRAGQFPERATSKRKLKQLDPFYEHLERRWNEGCHNATQLWREIQKIGFSGCRMTVSNLVARFRVPGTKFLRKVAAAGKPKLKRLLSSPRQLASLLAKKPGNLSPLDKKHLSGIAAANPIVDVLHRLVQDFSSLMRNRDDAGLSKWEFQAIDAAIPAITSFVKGIEKDRAAVAGAFSSPWSSGQVEGQVHRLKLIKRQMYGRAGFLLLRSRLLPLPIQMKQRSP